MNKRLLGFVMLLLVTATACKSKKGANSGERPSAAAASALESYQAMRQNDATFDELSAQGNLSADINDQSLSAAFNLKLQKDKQLWLSIKPMLGIEAVRVLIRPDSVFVLDRLNKAYLAHPFSWLVSLSQAPLSFAALQDILINNVGFLAEMRPELGAEGSLLFAQQGQQYKLLAGNSPAKAASLEAQQQQQQLKVDYLKWQELEKQWLPAQLKMAIKGKQSGTIELNFSKFVVENGQTYPFSIPGNYSKMD